MSKREQRPGDWLFVCDLSGMTGWASESALTSRGTRVLKRFLGQEAHKHPQEEPYRPLPDEGRVPWARPPGTAVFREPTDVQPSDL